MACAIAHTHLEAPRQLPPRALSVTGLGDQRGTETGTQERPVDIRPAGDGRVLRPSRAAPDTPAPRPKPQREGGGLRDGTPVDVQPTPHSHGQTVRPPTCLDILLRHAYGIHLAIWQAQRPLFMEPHDYFISGAKLLTVITAHHHNTRQAIQLYQAWGIPNSTIRVGDHVALYDPNDTYLWVCRKVVAARFPEAVWGEFLLERKNEFEPLVMCAIPVKDGWSSLPSILAFAHRLLRRFLPNTYPPVPETPIRPIESATHGRDNDGCQTQ
ncbi:hypothetical protein PsYK624_118770 [Phanerochaete sordida]|uniref:Uncharacterized protein n=1 Tax=Phanerochaete sordida TaxID=48140 RepID=A0A9P3GIQ2_9APHY|nr:hypothetical protein PsYK624_118770 [Phanerochaete sordida]